MIAARIASVDFDQARTDVAPFISDPRDLDVWSRKYFQHVLGQMVMG
jgi:hypothetical protein